MFIDDLFVGLIRRAICKSLDIPELGYPTGALLGCRVHHSPGGSCQKRVDDFRDGGRFHAIFLSEKHYP
jgi:hypothetical protein